MTEEERLAHSPTEVSTLTVQLLEEYRRNPEKVIVSGIPKLDQRIVPWRSHLVTVQGYTNHFKTSFMNILAQNVERVCEENDVIIYVDVENSLEESTIKDISQVSLVPVPTMLMGKASDKEWKSIMQAATIRATKKIWLLAHSEQDYRARRRATVPDLWEALTYIRDEQEKNIKMIVVDYFQRIRRHDTRQGHRVIYMEMVDMLQDLALGFGCPLLLGSQTARAVKNRQDKMPTLADLMETSNLEQSSRSAISLYMPGKEDYPLGTGWEFGGINYEVTENLIMISILKQKGVCPIHQPYYIDFENLRLIEIDKQSVRTL